MGYGTSHTYNLSPMTHYLQIDDLAHWRPSLCLISFAVNIFEGFAIGGAL